MQRSILTVLATLCLLAYPAAAQQVRGTVRDSVSQRPIAGAVVSLLDSAGNTAARNITNERGQYFFALSREVRRLQILRIGYRARTYALTAPPAQAAGQLITLDVSLTALTTMLAPMQVTAGGCPRSSDQGVAAALLEQARAGLLATVVARESHPSTQVRAVYERVMDGVSDRVLRQSVRLDSASLSTTSFASAYSASDFVQNGFMDNGASEMTFHAPDADVLLNDNFVSGYCFKLAKPERARPKQVGLAFAAARAVRGRVDVDGTLWIDTSARAIRNIEFKYRGLGPALEEFGPGGDINFRELTSGVVLVDRWQLRLVSATVDTVDDSNYREPQSRTIRPNFHVTESGGELASATWPDGFAWNAPLGALRVRAVTDKLMPVAGVAVQLANTDYRGVTDSSGNVHITRLVPGPYKMVVLDERLAAIDVEMETAINFVAVRDSTITAMFHPQSTDEYVTARCSDERKPAGMGSFTRIVGRVTAPDVKSLRDLRVGIIHEVTVGVWQAIDAFYKPGTDGLFWICSKQLRINMPIRIEVRRDGRVARTVPLMVTDTLMVTRIAIPPK